MASRNEVLEAIKNLVFAPKTIVSCPSFPVEIQGIVTGAAYIANDALGTVTIVRVPVSGVIYSATFFDLDYENTQVDLEIFKANYTLVADNAGWTCNDADILSFVTELNFFTFDGHAANYTSEITNIGKAYNAPAGYFYIQAVTRSTPTIAAGAIPRFQLQIQSFDPDFEV